MTVTRKILPLETEEAPRAMKVGNRRALVLDETISAALGLGSDVSEISLTIEDGRVTLLPPVPDAFNALRAKLATYSESEARRVAAAEVAALRPRTIRRWRATK